MILACRVSRLRNWLIIGFAAVSNWSQAWEKLLQPRNPAERLGNGQPTSSNASTSHPEPPIVKDVSFREDNGEALLFLLRIAHLQFDAVPKVLELSDLFGLAVLCERYECHGLVRPWTERLIPNLTPLRDFDRWLYISWAFGMRSQFTNIAKILVEQATILLPSRKLSMINPEVYRLPMPETIIG